jgi:surface protein
MEIITNRNLKKFVKSYLENNPNNYPPIGTWDVSRVTDMSRVFIRKNFNENINNWDVSNVTHMYETFKNCETFNQPLNNWNVSNVTDMTSMLNGCETFNQPLNDWNVSNVTDMTSMLHGCKTFNQPLNNWDVSNVKYMHELFGNCKNFNQPLNNWNVSNAIIMTYMFAFAIKFNQPLNNWNVSNVTDMCCMFKGCLNFNQDLNNWDVSNVMSFREMFYLNRNVTPVFDYRNVSNWNFKIDAYVDDDFINWWEVQNHRIFRSTEIITEEQIQNERQNEIERQRQNQIERQRQTQVERQNQIERQRQINERNRQLAQNVVVEESEYKMCPICLAEPLDNVNGPGPNTYCQENCNDAIIICKNNHITHRGCILSMCNTTTIYTTDNVFGISIPSRHNINRGCPICRSEFIVPCTEFNNPLSAPKITDMELLKETKGGRRKTKRRKIKRRKTKRRKTKRRT